MHTRTLLKGGRIGINHIAIKTWRMRCVVEAVTGEGTLGHAA